MSDEKQISGGVVHDLPKDLEDALRRDPKALATWEDITPLARNEWICWVESAKKVETRLKRIDWGRENLSDGKRRPCCWPGCSHRRTRDKKRARHPEWRRTLVQNLIASGRWSLPATSGSTAAH
jgi:hypothetical protein